jgi:hypothetical protein
VWRKTVSVEGHCQFEQGERSGLGSGVRSQVAGVRKNQIKFARLEFHEQLNI